MIDKPPSMVAERSGLLIHAGYPKTGSSWIQRFLFQNSDAGFAPLFGEDVSMRGAVMKVMILPNALVFDPIDSLKHFHPAILEVTGKGLVPVLSHERLAGTPHSGGYDSKELANRLAAVFPGAKVLLVIREQKSMIVSTYKQYVRNGGPCSLGGYLRPPRSDGRMPLFDFGYFEYHRLVGYYQELFGQANVLVLPYEQFRDDPKGFVWTIVTFAGAKARPGTVEGLSYSTREYPGLSGFSIAIKRRLNRIVGRRDSVNPQVLIPISRGRELVLERFLKRLEAVVPGSFHKALDQRLTAAVFRAIGDRYTRSNSLLAELLGLELGRYGYDVG